MMECLFLFMSGNSQFIVVPGFDRMKCYAPLSVVSCGSSVLLPINADCDFFTGVGCPFYSERVMDEAPAIAKGFKQQLEPGMTFAVEPKIALPGLGMVGTENTYVITERGARSLTGRSHSLRVIE